MDAEEHRLKAVMMQAIAREYPLGDYEDILTFQVDSDRKGCDFAIWHRYLGDTGVKVPVEIVRDIERGTGFKYTHTMTRYHMTAYVFKKVE